MANLVSEVCVSRFPRDRQVSYETWIRCNSYNTLKMDTASDSDILKKAKNDNRVILTHDLDFGKLLSFSGANMPSVVVFRLNNMKPENVNSYCQKIISLFHNELENGAILSVGDKKIRCHNLPITSAND